MLKAVARALEARRGELIEVAASETGKVFAEADVEVSEAVDFANYYAATARELDRVSGAVFVPARLTVVTPPWNFPVAIPAGGVLAALAAGSGVVFKPAPQARRCAAVVAKAVWEVLDATGVPRDVLALVDVDEGALGQRLVSHPEVDRVILTGAYETAQLFRSFRADLPLGKIEQRHHRRALTPFRILGDVPVGGFLVLRRPRECAPAGAQFGGVGSGGTVSHYLSHSPKTTSIAPRMESRWRLRPATSELVFSMRSWTLSVPWRSMPR